MTDADAVVHDVQRLAARRRLVLLDTPPSPPFDQLTRMAARLLRAPLRVHDRRAAYRRTWKGVHRKSP